MIALLKKLDAWLAAHPAITIAAVTVGAGLLARFGFHVTPGTVAQVEAVAVAIIAALAGSSLHRAKARVARSK